MKRAAVIKTMRTALDEAGYTEVETPILQSIPGGQAHVRSLRTITRWISTSICVLLPNCI